MRDNVWFWALDVIKFEEGFESHEYLCSEGYKTIGFGSRTPIKRSEVEAIGAVDNWRKVGITEVQAELLLKLRLNNMWTRLRTKYVGAAIDELPEPVQVALASMIYQLGVAGLLKFKKTLQFIAQRNWAEAAREMLDSDWAREQTPARAKRMSRLVAGCA